jgi:MinD-like ATPase involved in chromosome partitioning or flagellar assembly
MEKTITINSYLEHAGKTTIAANVATILAASGKRIGLIEADIQAANLQQLFKLNPAAITYTFNDYLHGRCEAPRAAYEVTPPIRVARSGGIYLLPASPEPHNVASILREGYHIELITDQLWELAENLDLDILILDPHALKTDQSLLSILSMAIADMLIAVLCLDQDSYLGTQVLLDVARTLEVPNITLVANQITESVTHQAIKTRLEETYQGPVLGTIPYTEEIARLPHDNLFVVHYPDHPTTATLTQLANSLLA